MTRSQEAGYKMADALIEWVHLMYQHNTALHVIKALIERVSERIEEFK